MSTPCLPGQPMQQLLVVLAAVLKFKIIQAEENT
jgi:hypothetical protein